MLRGSGGDLGVAGAGATSWQGDAAESFRGAVSAEQGRLVQGAGALEKVAGELERLAGVIEAAQEKVLGLARKVEAAEEEADRAEARAALASVAAGAAELAVSAFGPDPPPVLTEASQDAGEAAGRAGRGAAAARAQAAEVRRKAQEQAREICQDCVREDATSAGVIEGAELGGAVGSGFGVPAGAQFAAGIARRMTVSDFKELAFLRAGIDPTKWNPREGIDANDETVRAVYAYYRRFGLEDEAYEWMKIAALGGPAFYAGFRDLDAAGDLAPPLGGLAGVVGAKELKWYEGQFLTMQKAIFSDLAWQQEAYAIGGAATIRGAVDKLPATERLRVMDRDTLAGWDGIASGDPQRVTDGNFKLFEREQNTVIQSYYDDMSDRLSGPAVTGFLTDRTELPVPHSQSYNEYSSKGNIANLSDRMAWIRNDLWPAYQRQLDTPGAVEALLARDFDSQVDRYRQVTPKAIGKDIGDSMLDGGKTLIEPFVNPRLPRVP